MMRRVRSYVRRGRMTSGQAAAHAKLWPLIGGSVEAGPIDYIKMFNRITPVFLEIGFGSGQSLLALAQKHPEYNFIGIETHSPGIGAILLGIQKLGLTNIRLYEADAVQVLKQVIAPNSLSGVQLFFPDPWPKRKHHERRLIQLTFIDLIVEKLRENGELHLATDWEDYAHHMMKVLSQSSGLKNCFGVHQFAPRSPMRPIVTKFERRAESEGRAVWELQFARCSR